VSRPPIFEDWPSTLPTPWGPYRAVVASIYDGDTPRFWVSLGLDEYAWVDIRLADVRAPEIRSSNPVEKQHAIEARDYLASLIPPGTKLRIRTEQVEGADEVTTFARYVAWLTREDGLDVNAAMIEWLATKGYTGGA
jgi:endonuclease YncB( thermonuclease family)